jgi:ribosomal protein S18 acetylase RimI-like enzyme
MTELEDADFVPVTAAELRTDPLRAVRLAELAMGAQPLFYRATAIEGGALVEAVARQIAEPGFDMAVAFVLRAGGNDIALIAGLPLAALASAQAASMAALLKLAPASARKQTAAAIKRYAAGIEPIADTGHYVSRVAVVPARKGQGLGRQALSLYLDRLGAVATHLHVHRENAPAIALYRALGFVPRSRGTHIFPAFTRQPD